MLFKTVKNVIFRLLKKAKKNIFMLKSRGFLRVYLALLLFSGIEADGNNNFLKVLLNESVPPVVEHVLVDAKALLHVKRCNLAVLELAQVVRTPP